jgi:hypothetical protein
MGTKPVLLHLDEGLHAALAKAAAERGTNVSALLREGAELVLASLYGGDRRRSADVKAGLEELSWIIRQLQDGHVLVPRDTAGPGSFDELMREGST